MFRSLGLSYRRYAKMSLLPTIRRTSTILRNHAATMDVSNSRNACPQHRESRPQTLAEFAAAMVAQVAVGGLAAGEVPGQAKRRASRCVHGSMAWLRGTLGGPRGCLGRRRRFCRHVARNAMPVARAVLMHQVRPRRYNYNYPHTI